MNWKKSLVNIVGVTAIVINITGCKDDIDGTYECKNLLAEKQGILSNIVITDKSFDIVTNNESLLDEVSNKAMEFIQIYNNSVSKDKVENIKIVSKLKFNEISKNYQGTIEAEGGKDVSQMQKFNNTKQFKYALEFRQTAPDAIQLFKVGGNILPSTSRIFCYKKEEN